MAHRIVDQKNQIEQQLKMAIGRHRLSLWVPQKDGGVQLVYAHLLAMTSIKNEICLKIDQESQADWENYDGEDIKVFSDSGSFYFYTRYQNISEGDCFSLTYPEILIMKDRRAAARSDNPNGYKARVHIGSKVLVKECLDISKKGFSLVLQARDGQPFDQGKVYEFEILGQDQKRRVLGKIVIVEKIIPFSLEKTPYGSFRVGINVVDGVQTQKE